MSQSVGLPVRSFLTAGVSAAMVGAVALAPVTISQQAAVSAPIHMVAPAIQLTTAGDTIIAAYTALQPWVAYGFQLADYALSFVPGLWWIAPAVDLAYYTAQPLVEAGVYSFAALIDGNWGLIGPIVQNGIQNSINNFVQYGIAWIGSLVPLPPLPPFPPFPGAAMKTPATARTAPRAAAVAATVPAETPTVTETAVTDAAPVAVTAPRSRRDAARAATRAARSVSPAAASADDNSSSDAASPAKASRKAHRGA